MIPNAGRKPLIGSILSALVNDLTLALLLAAGCQSSVAVALCLEVELRFELSSGGVNQGDEVS